MQPSWRAEAAIAAGTLTAAPSFGSGVTTLTATGSRFETFMEGWLIAPDAACSTHGFAYLEILEVTSTNSLTVKGDLTWMVTGDERFWIFAPPSVDAQTGAIRGTYTGSTFKPAKCDSRYLWAQYRYMPPMAGYEVNPGTPGIYGKQPGTNQAGTYHAWNRQYDPGTGRWTTPDPVTSPWSNLYQYCSTRPMSRSDHNGLMSFTIDDDACTITMKFTISFRFQDDVGGKWTTAEEKQYITTATQAIQNAWNNKLVLKPGKKTWSESVWDPGFERDIDGAACLNSFRLWRTVTHACPCQDGYAVRVNIWYVHGAPRSGVEVDVTAKVLKWTKGGKQHISSANTSSATLDDDDDIKEVPTGQDSSGKATKQVPIAHEFGHMIGLGHSNPKGKGQDEYNEPGTTGPNNRSQSIMGAGMEVRPEHAAKWKEHLDEARSECGPFTAHIK